MGEREGGGAGRETSTGLRGMNIAIPSIDWRQPKESMEQAI